MKTGLEMSSMDNFNEQNYVVLKKLPGPAKAPQSKTFKKTISSDNLPPNYCLQRNPDEYANLFMPQHVTEYKVEVYEQELVIKCDVATEKDIEKALGHFTFSSKISFSKKCGNKIGAFRTYFYFACHHGYRAANKRKLQAG